MSSRKRARAARAELGRVWSEQDGSRPGRHRRRQRHRHRRSRRVFGRVLRAGLWMMLATAVIVPAMIAFGFLLGPRGVEGLFAAPLILGATWWVILYFALLRRPPVRMIANADVDRLPERTDDWLDHQRRLLPASADSLLDGIAQQLEALAPQLSGLDRELPIARELRRLLAEELPELVSGYQKVPRALQQQPAHGGRSPERQLIDGLATIDVQLGRLSEQLAAEDLRALATHSRYLDLKYKRDDELE